MASRAVDGRMRGVGRCCAAGVLGLAAALPLSSIQAQPATRPGVASAETEAAIRDRCNAAEPMIAAGHAREAAQALDAIAKNTRLADSRARRLALFLYGRAQFELQNYQSAGWALSQLSPFDNIEYGLNARYLLARVHQQSGERAEALALYESIVTDYPKHRAAAGNLLRDPDAFKDRFADAARLQALAKLPGPDFIAQATYQSAVVLAEDGRFAEAAARFAQFTQQYPQSPLVNDARLRQGIAHVQAKQFAEAMNVLRPLGDDAALGDQALLWAARATLGGVDVHDGRYPAAVQTATDQLKRASDRVEQVIANHTGDATAALSRRVDIELDLADALQAGGKFIDAAKLYEKVEQDKLASAPGDGRAEDAMHRRCTALHFARLYRDSDALCDRFTSLYGKSPLLAMVRYRWAQNALDFAQSGGTSSVGPAVAPTPGGAAEAMQTRLYGEAIQRYVIVIDRFPEFALLANAKLDLATAYYRLARYPEAIAALQSIPEGDRSGDLAIANYMLADGLLRTLDPDTTEAIAAERTLQQIESAAKLLAIYVEATPRPPSPQRPDAMLKLGYCYQRIAELVIQPAEKQKLWTAAAQIYDRVQSEHGRELSAVASAVLERGRVQIALGDVNGAIGYLSRFRDDNFRRTSAAPRAVVELSKLLRARRSYSEALKLVSDYRAAEEKRLAADAALAANVPLLQLEQAIVLKESNQPIEAQALFDAIAKQFAGKPEGDEAEARGAAMKREAAAAAIESSRRALAQPGVAAADAAAAQAIIDKQTTALAASADALLSRAEELSHRAATSDPHLMLLHEAAVENRLAGGPREEQARQILRRILAAAPDSSIALMARLELAEMLAAKGEHDAVVTLMLDGLDRDPPRDAADRFLVRLANAMVARGDLQPAARLLDRVLRNNGSVALSDARSLLGEIRQRERSAPVRGPQPKLN